MSISGHTDRDGGWQGKTNILIKQWSHILNKFEIIEPNENKSNKCFQILKFIIYFHSKLWFLDLGAKKTSYATEFTSKLLNNFIVELLHISPSVERLQGESSWILSEGTHFNVNRLQSAFVWINLWTSYLIQILHKRFY